MCDKDKGVENTVEYSPETRISRISLKEELHQRRKHHHMELEKANKMIKLLDENPLIEKVEEFRRLERDY